MGIDPEIREDEYEFFDIAVVDDINPGQRLYLQIDDKPIIVFNIEGKYFAIDDECTHDNGALGDGRIDGFSVTCPRHGAKFDVRTGQALRLPAVKSIKTYPVRIEQHAVQIGLKK